MPRSNKTKDTSDAVQRAAAKHEARLEEAEDHLEKSAHGAEASFYEHGAKPEARLEEAEDHLEKSARKADTVGEPGSEAG
jgi:ElaB/YqjD/DUF883 family membrane-anchored ribosome-binding protein